MGGFGMKWRHFHCHCHDFRFYVTLFPKCFSNFRSRYLFAIGLPTLCLTLADTYLPIDTAFPSSATLLAPLNEMQGLFGSMGYHLLWLNTHTRVVFSNGFALHIEFRQSRTNHRAAFMPQLKALKTRFGNEFGPSSLAAD